MRSAMPRSDRPCAMRPQHLALTVAEDGEGGVGARPAGRPAGGPRSLPPSATWRIRVVEHLGDQHVVLEQVADAARLVVRAAGGSRRRRAGKARARRAPPAPPGSGGRPHALAGVGRRHPDIQHHEVRPSARTGAGTVSARSAAATTSSPPRPQPGQTLTHQHLVLRDDQAHGISSLTRFRSPARSRASSSRRPSLGGLARRPARLRSRPHRPQPSSRTDTTRTVAQVLDADASPR